MSQGSDVGDRLGPILTVEGIDKSYGGVHALKSVTWSVDAGEVHGLVGENGAGKSTLIKMISGAESPDAGRILVGGDSLPLGDTQASLAAGVSPVYQEPQLFADLTVQENIFLGREETRAGRVRWREQSQRAAELLERLQLDPSILQRRVGDLAVGVQQLVSIAKAFVTDVRLLILDEPSAILSHADIDRLFTIVRTLRAEGIGVIYISHRLDEIREITDRVTVMRDGEVIATEQAADLTPADIATLMVGDKFQIADRSARPSHATEEVMLDVDGLGAGSRLSEASFCVHRGEILGVYGLIGSGTTELVRALYGITPVSQGSVTLEGNPVAIRSPRQAMRLGMTMLPGNRKTQGVFLPKSLSFNLTSSHLQHFSTAGVLDRGAERSAMTEAMGKLRIKAPDTETVISSLSGGNQQKVVMARQLVRQPKVLLVEEPTQGVDVGAKSEIHNLIVEHVSGGHCAVVVSTDLEEIRYLCDRIVVLHQGRSAVTLSGDVDAGTLLRAASGDVQGMGSDSGEEGRDVDE